MPRDAAPLLALALATTLILLSMTAFSRRLTVSSKFWGVLIVLVPGSARADGDIASKYSAKPMAPTRAMGREEGESSWFSDGKYWAD